jgi:Flp pilus assembly protein TadG
MKATMKLSETGVALTEFALILPLLLILTFITTEFGRALYQYNTITKSVRDAARYLSVQTAGTKITEAKNLVVFGNTAGTGAGLTAGLTISNVPNPTWQPAGTNPTINTVTIRVTNYTFRSLFTSAFGVTFGNITYGPISATMRSAT